MCTKQSNKDFALKLVLMEMDRLLRLAQGIRRDDYTNKDLKEIIKQYEDTGSL